MRRKFVKAPMDDIDEKPLGWVDEYLDEDAVDLDEWAFMQGYYGEI